MNTHNDKEAAAKLGYKVIAASPYEVGLVKGNRGIKTWWANDFNGALPELDHPIILETIRKHEAMLHEN